MKKALILFSGGLDSRVTAKFMEELGFEIHLVSVKLPFGAGCGSFEGIKEFAQEQNFKLDIFDVTEGKLLEEYLEFIKNPRYGYGTAINPCKDCKIFIFNQGKKIASEIGADVICTGEVLGQRPMSQMKKALMLDEKEAGLSGKILRPLSAKLLPETDYEKNGIVDREKLFSLQGRQRNLQIELAEKYKIKYPTPGGGCLLCDKFYEIKLRILLEYHPHPSMNEISLLKLGRMFRDKGLIFIGRTEEENESLKIVSQKLSWNIFFNEEIPGPTIIFEDKEDFELSKKLWEAYSKNNLEQRKEFDKFKV